MTAKDMEGLFVLRNGVPTKTPLDLVLLYTQVLTPFQNFQPPCTECNPQYLLYCLSIPHR